MYIDDMILKSLKYIGRKMEKLYVYVVELMS